ncbi:Mediator of RNA polymerase II transcription subunit [Sesamum angolense]|uniref:Mediator of RNA polymerase II transcription subunit n=1 Tax=Sesamum angolense TaxID=2727404 RepID=A0AAE1WWY5_9LAMI|nr:Mediator of RNA polymerase II transcription subunit [Sesamum angolense]
MMKRVNLIRRIDFAWAVEREDPSKKQKSEGASAKEGTSTSQQQWPWQSLVENLQLAHQELSVIIDLINTVEANDAVTVAGMTRPKQLPNEHLSDLAVSTATKLQCFRNLGKYFKQSAKSLEEQIAREARFYGALIRLQQNWKIKRHRLVAAASGNEGFYIDLFDNSLYDSAAIFRPSSLSTIPIEHDAAGMLAVNLPRKSCHSLQFEVLGLSSASNLGKSGETKTSAGGNDSSKEPGKEYASNDERVREIHLTLREVHRAIHDEQVFDLVNREACNPSLVNDETNGSSHRNTTETSCVPSASVDGAKFGGSINQRNWGSQVHLVYRTPYVHLVSHPTWHSRTSSWTLSVKIPQSILHAGSQIPMPTAAAVKNIRSQFWTRVLVIDDSIRVEGEGAPNVVGLFRGRPDSVSSINGYDCDLVDLPIILLQQLETVVFLVVLCVLIRRSLVRLSSGCTRKPLLLVSKRQRDFLSLAFELDQGEIVRLVAHVDPEDTQGCISWWLTVDDGIVEEHKLHPDMSDVESESRKFLGYLSLEVLYSTLLDFLNLCSC